MKPKDFLFWVRYQHMGGKRMYNNYVILRKYNNQAYDKLVGTGKFKIKKIELGRVLEFPVKG
jgi:hypothetical protein